MTMQYLRQEHSQIPEMAESDMEDGWPGPSRAELWPVSTALSHLNDCGILHTDLHQRKPQACSKSLIVA